MNSKRIKTTISIVIVIILCLLLSTLLFSMYSIKDMNNNLQVQVDTRTVVVTLKDNLTILVNAETGERGYVITGDTTYLQPYNEARKKLADNTAVLNAMLKTDASQQKELDSLNTYISRKISYIEKIINLKKAGDEKTIKDFLRSRQGKFLMDKVRESNQKLQNAEETLFNERKVITDRSILRTRIVFLIDGLLSLLFVLFLASIVISELNRRTRNEKMLKDYTIELQRKNEEIEQFAFIASHDLQQPLRSISNFTKLLEEKVEDNGDEDTKQYMQFIKGGATRMSALIADLLEYSRVGKDTEKRKIDCNVLVKEILSDMTAAIEETHAEITIGNLPVLTGFIYLKSVFRNLLGNAVKFMRKDVKPVVSIACKDMGKEYLFSVKDNGIGIEKIYLDRIFVIFQRLHTRHDYPGTGIGLSICKKIVELHGGKIWVESEPGKGSSFYFTIAKNLV